MTSLKSLQSEQIPENQSSAPYHRHPKPPYSYIALIAMAIKDSPNEKLTLAEINEYLMRNFEFFRGAYQGWKNSIRHNLSLNECFVKILRDPKRPWGKDNFWALNPESEYTFADGVFRRRRKRLQGKSQHHNHPNHDHHHDHYWDGADHDFHKRQKYDSGDNNNNCSTGGASVPLPTMVTTTHFPHIMNHYGAKNALFPWNYRNRTGADGADNDDDDVGQQSGENVGEQMMLLLRKRQTTTAAAADERKSEKLEKKVNKFSIEELLKDDDVKSCHSPGKMDTFYFGPLPSLTIDPFDVLMNFHQR